MIDAFGLFSNGLRLADARTSYEDDIREIVTCDRLGFQEVWLSEHTGQRKAVENSVIPLALPAVELLICKAAGLTRQIRLGPAVRRIALYPPQLVALEGAVADHLTGGRYNFGFGVGPPLSNYRQWGIADQDAEARTLEALELLLKCWEEPGPFGFEGRFFQGRDIDILPRPLQSRLPMAVATMRASLLDMAAERGYRILTTWTARTEAMQAMGEAFDAACVKHSGATRRRDIIAARAIFVADTDEKALAAVERDWKRHLDSMLKFQEPAASQYARPGGGAYGVTFADMVDTGNVILGSPATVIDAIRHFHDSVGGFGTLLLVGGRDIATAQQRDDMFHLFAEAVAPRLLNDPDRMRRAGAGGREALRA